MKQSPIFVCGPNRSGTSLLYALLASHPHISMVQRTDMWRYFYDQYGDLSQSDNFENCLEALLRYRRVTRLEPDAARIRREFWQGPPTYGRLFSLIHEHYAEQVGRSRWGDKSLHTEHHADQVFAEIPHAKMIQVVRDPRDRYASEQKKYNASVASATSKWLASTRAAIQNLQRYPDHYMVVRYESLASSPVETLRQVCDFIGEPYFPVMLAMQGAPEHLEQGGDSSFENYAPGEISTRSIGRFRKVISKRDIAFIQACAGREMAAFDYQLDPVDFSLGDRLSFYLVAYPNGLARMSYKNTLRKIRDRKGRTVPSRRVTDSYYAGLMQEA